MPSTWNVNDYKTDFESEEHWELRRSFMLAHKDKLPEDEIVCLAQVFTNIEFLGCRYPEETMKKVAELAKGVVEPYRERKKNCLKRTFVAASDAAVAKVKGQRSSSEVNQSNEANDTDDTDEIDQDTDEMENLTFQSMLGIETDPVMETNPTLPEPQEFQINPIVQKLQDLQTYSAVQKLQNHQTNTKSQKVEDYLTNTRSLKLEDLLSNPKLQKLEKPQKNPIFQKLSELQTNQTVEELQGLQTNSNCLKLEDLLSNPKLRKLEKHQTNPVIQKLQELQTNQTVEELQDPQPIPTILKLQDLQTNKTTETLQGLQTSSKSLKLEDLLSNPKLQKLENHQTFPVIQKLQGFRTCQTVANPQTNPILQKLRDLQNNPTQKMQKLEISETTEAIHKIQANPINQKILVNSGVQTNQTLQKNQTHQAIQTVQIIKVDQTVQTYLPDEVIQRQKPTQSTQGTQTVVSNIPPPVKQQNQAKKPKKQKKNKKAAKKNKEKDTDNDAMCDADDGDDGGVTVITHNNSVIPDERRCIWDDVEISGHTNSHSDQLIDSKGSNCSDSKQPSAIEFLSSSTSVGYTLDPSGVKKLNELKPRFVFFLYDEPPVNLLQRNATLNRGTLRWHFDGQKGNRACSVYYNGILLGSSGVCPKKQAKERAAKEAIKNLRSLCYTVKIKKHVRCLNKVTPAALGCPAGEIKLKSAIGEQIMRLMGWSGGGLGVKQQGMIQPVSLLPNSGRDGLGLARNVKQDPGFRKRADAFLKRWIQTDSEEDLVFSTDFTQAQREILHKLASDLNLKSKSYGKNGDRYIVIYKKPVPWLIVEKLVRMGGSTNRYELIIPTVTIP